MIPTYLIAADEDALRAGRVDGGPLWCSSRQVTLNCGIAALDRSHQLRSFLPNCFRILTSSRVALAATCVLLICAMRSL
jgi:hypothetical protein